MERGLLTRRQVADGRWLFLPRHAGGGGQEHPGVQAVSTTDLLPSLILLSPGGDSRRLVLTRADNAIGRDPAQCPVVLADDPMTSPKHARIFRDEHGRWMLENLGSLNGTWLRVDRVLVDRGGQFQLGEQRSVLRGF